jgi:hypothetical protein
MRLKTERSVVSTQAGEQLGLAQRRVRARAVVTDRSSKTTMGPVPRIALARVEPWALVCRSEESFVERALPRRNVVGSAGRRSIVVKRAPRTASGSSPAEPDPLAALVGVFEQSFEAMSLQLGPDWAFRGAGGCWRA